MEKYLNSNLITEASEFKKTKSGEKSEEYDTEEEKVGGFFIVRINVKKATENYRRGRYVTVYSSRVHQLSAEEQRELSLLIAGELKRMLCLYIEKSKKIGEFLVAGIGNREIASDSLGPLTAEKIHVTRHIKQMEEEVFKKMKKHSVSAINGGVMGETGINTAEIIKGVVEKISPDAVIAVDALASKSTESLGAVIQISDNGISPGAGIGNRFSRVDAESIGVPVIAIGVPTVVSASTLVGDVLLRQGIKITASISRELERGRKFFVAPKECDIICKIAAHVLADGINGALTL